MEPLLLSQRFGSRLSGYICLSCRHALRRRTPTVSLSPRSARLKSNSSRQLLAGGQAHPLTGYYADMLTRPQETIASKHIELQPAAPEGVLSTKKDEMLLRTQKMMFGDREASARERRREIEAKSVEVAGIKIPPKPEEPDNCCMSGCVNCVWDLFREEYEDWAAKSKAANRAMRLNRNNTSSIGVADSDVPQHVMYSMDDDGGGSNTNWDEGGFSDIPVGIREFMKTEKLLKLNKLKQSNAP